ncbi:MAG: DoxX family protein [Candidatus Taylorbacteria bacterium]
MKKIITKEQATDVSLLLLRMGAFVIFFQAGGLKLFGWFGGMPPGFELGALLTTAGILEVVGGSLVLLGLFTRPVAFILSGEMAVAYFIGHFPSGVWPIQNHGETAFLLCFVFLFLSAYGAGKWSVDAYVRSRRKGNYQ